MLTSILATKLFAPRQRSRSVPRPQLIQRLNEALAGRLTLISAPAGFGKTTLASQWIIESEYRHAWLSLDKSDSDPARFLIYVISAFEKIIPNVGAGLIERLQSSQSLSYEPILTALINNILVSINEPVIFVLDDYHILDSPAVDRILEFLIEHQPPQMHLVITTREDPSFSFTRLRVRGELTEIRIADLRFTTQEIASFLNESMGLNLSTDDISTLEARTEGWIASLQMLALSLHGRTDITDFIEAFTGSHRFVVDYLLEEVLNRQSNAIREFLLHTSILDQLNGSLCDAVTGRHDSQKILEQLERDNLFVIPLDDERGWYRYHHLFGDALRNTLRGENPDILPILHRRASGWYTEHNKVQNAIDHALSGLDNEHAADLIESTWSTMASNYQSARWISQVQQLPDDLIRRYPLLCVGYGWTLLYRGEFDDAESWFQIADHWLDAPDFDVMRVTDTDAFEMLPATLHSARAYRAMALGDTESALHHARTALHIGDNPHHTSWSQAMSLAGIAYWVRGDLVEADHTLSNLIAHMRQVGRIGDAAELVFTVGEVRWARGEINSAFRLYQETFQILSDMGNPTVVGIEDLHRGVVDFYREWGEWNRAEDHLMLATEIGALAINRPDWQNRLNLTAARLRLSQGNHDEALSLAQQAVSNYSRSPIPIVRTAHATRALIWIRQGNLDMASHWVHEMQLTIDDALTYLNTFTYLTFARLLIADGNLSQADTLLSRLLQSAREDDRIDHVIESLMLMALVYDTQGQTIKANEALHQALILAEPLGYVRLFLDEGTPMTSLLRQVSNDSPIANYAKRLLNSTNGKISPQSSSQPLVEPLSERELDVLRLIASGYTNQAIADELFIALSTVKKHANNIYGKLNVANRTQAINRANELNIL